MSRTGIDSNKQLIQEYFDAWEANDPARLTELFTDDFTYTYEDHDGSDITVAKDGTGDVDLREWFADYAENLPDKEVEIHEMVAEEDRVIARITAKGTYAGEFLGIEATGTEIEMEEYLTFRIVDWGISELTFLGDYLGVLQQLDVELPIDG